MSGGEPDPIKDWLVSNFGRTRSDRGGDEGQAKPRARKFVPVAQWVIVLAALVIYSPQLAAAGSNPKLTEFAALVHGYVAAAILVVVVAVAVDLVRHRRFRYRSILEALVRQAIRQEPVRVRVALVPGFWALCSARVRLQTATIIRPKDLDELLSAIRKSGLRQHGPLVRARRSALELLTPRFPRLAGRSQGWVVSVRHEAHRDLLVVSRRLVAAEKRSALSTLEEVVHDSPLKDPKVTIESRDADGVETGYRISFRPTVNTGAETFQTRLQQSLETLAGKHESGRLWVTEWHADQGYLLLRLQEPLPRRKNHPLELIDEDLRHLPYATGAADLTLFWDVSTKSNKPHCLIVGPTGGGKTSVIRTLLTEAARRGIPFLGVDPKMIELDGLEGYPGCGAIVYDPLRSAMLVRALHAEMTARNHYVHVHKIEPSELPLLIAVLDEFFILSGKWQRLAKSGDETTRKLLAELDPLGAWADLAVLARSAGIRLLLGVQRPDASLFGSSSGNARDNFGTRMSLGNLSQDGALMMWGDAHVGRDVDTSIPGRGMVTAPDGSPNPAQMWWTPNVDRHPNKWNQLSAEEKALVEGLMPAEAPKFVIYSPELRAFLESERALAKQARENGTAPEPTVLGAEEDMADAIPASAVTVGMTVLIDDDEHGLVQATVEAVSVIRDKQDNVLETRLVIATNGRAKVTATFTANEVVFLPEPDCALAAA